jgi:hypothetical protein
MPFQKDHFILAMNTQLDLRKEAYNLKRFQVN